MLSVTLDNTLTPGLKAAPAVIREAVDGVVLDTADKTFARIKRFTPRNTGKAAGDWYWIEEGTGDDKRISYVNDVAYINVLEYGGYPVIPTSRKRSGSGGIRRGKAYLGGDYPPGPNTQLEPGGDPVMRSNVSRKAPSGMVRKQLEAARPEFLSELDAAIERALEGLGA